MHYPILYQVNTRHLLAEVSKEIGRPATLDDISDDSLNQLAKLGFQWLYMICMWKTGDKEIEIAREQANLQKDAQRLLGKDADQAICSSCFAISGYEVTEEWGGFSALQRLRERMSRFGMRLILDFIPNHTGLSHPWAKSNPDYYLNSDIDAVDTYDRAVHIETNFGPRLLMHGRDPFFPPWSDTLQLNYANPELHTAMIDELLKIADYCDGLRCDMAMLVLPEVFEKTWGKKISPFWPEAIAMVREIRPDFIFLAEVYWNLEQTIIDQGFDYAYDKLLYDVLRERVASQIYTHIQSNQTLLPNLAHFLENHDEPRAAATFQNGSLEACALICYFLPGLRFFFAGQLEGHRQHIPIQFCFAPHQARDDELHDFYASLMKILAGDFCQRNSFQLLQATPAWYGNESWRNIIAYAWTGKSGERWLLTVNFSNEASQCYFILPFTEINGHSILMEDVLHGQIFERSGSQMFETGIYIDRQAWGYHLFVLNIADHAS